MKKQKLFKELNFLSDTEIRRVINDVISENRKLPLNKAKWIKVLYPSEVKMVNDFFGIEK